MNTLARIATALLPAAMFLIGPPAAADAPFHVGICTGKVPEKYYAIKKH